MIRYNYINRLVLQVYASLDKIVFPINPKDIIKQFLNCRYLSYQKFAEINGCTVDEVIEVCKSKSGCTQWDMDTNRFLILCNESTENHNNYGRQRWTLFHEIGHILCKHHSLAALEMLSEGNEESNKEFEYEADYFAATVAAPFPLFKELGVKSVMDIQTVFGLSAEAALHRYDQYMKWQKDHKKTAWENDMVKLYRKRNNLPLYKAP